MTRSLITTVDLKASIENNMILKGISVDFFPNELTAIIGPSGCGKSTFIRCLNRLHEEIAGAEVMGEVLHKDVNIYDAQVDPVRVRSHIGMLFQKPNPFPHMSIFDNVAVGLKLRGGVSKKELKEKVEIALKKSALWEEVKDKLNAQGTSLSGGQQQRLCLARTIIMEPEVILMDEPTSALDPIATAKIEELMLELKKQYCVIVVTHNMQQAKRVSDRTAFFYLGNLIEIGKTYDIFNHPKEAQTRSYISGEFG